MTILHSYKLTIAAALIISGSAAFAQSGSVDPMALMIGYR